MLTSVHYKVFFCEIFLCEINISMTHRKLCAFLQQHSLNTVQSLSRQGTWQMLNFKYFKLFRPVSSIFFWGGEGVGKGEAYFRFAWNEKSVICSCVPNWFYFVLWSCTAWNIAQAHEKWSFLDKLTVWIISPKFLGRLRRGWYWNCTQWQQFQI